MKPISVAIGTAVALLVILGVQAAQAPTYELRPDTVTKIEAHLEFDTGGTLTAFKVVATLETPLINTSDLRDTPRHKAGEITLDLFGHADRAAMINEELIAAIARKEWLRIHPQVFMPQRRNLREPAPAPTKGPNER